MTAERIIRFLKVNGKSRPCDIKRELGVCDRTVTYVLSRLLQRGIVRKTIDFDDMRNAWYSLVGVVR